MHFRATRIKSLEQIFLTFELLKTCFDAFPGHQNQVLRKDIFQRQKRVLIHLRILSDHQNQVLRKIIF
jgi:hypothetical protein